MGAKLKPKNANIPWIVSFEFHCHADANAFALLVEEQFGDRALVRKKNEVFNQGAFVNWRTTSAIRAALNRRSFTTEMVGEALANSGYAGTRGAATSWLVRAAATGVIERLERGVYEFPRHAKQPSPADSKCLACQPEVLQCAAQ